MKAVWFCWLVLYVHDVFSKILVIPIDDLGFDIGVYILTSGALAIMTTSRYLPTFLETRFKIMEVALKTVITRLATIAIGVVSVLNAGVCFGLPASSILGVSGVGGLTFGLAAKDILSNFMGGTILAILRPFTVGEEIFITGGSNFRGSGDPSVSDYLVKEIGWYQTRYWQRTPSLRLFQTVSSWRQRDQCHSSDRQGAHRRSPCVVPRPRQDIHDMRGARGVFARQRPHRQLNFPVRVNLTSAKADCLNVQVETHIYKLPLDKHLKAKMKTMMDMMDIVDGHTSGVAYPVEVQLETLPGLSGKK